MDRTVPLGAAMLLDFIGDIEAPKGYGTIYANKQHKLSKALTPMTLGDVVDAQAGWSKNHGSSAAGRYQPCLRSLTSDALKQITQSIQGLLLQRILRGGGQEAVNRRPFCENALIYHLDAKVQSITLKNEMPGNRTAYRQEHGLARLG